MEVQGGRLVRVSGGEAEELHPVGERKLGQVRDLAPDPSGLTYIAADGGLFVAAPGVRALEELVRREGAPAGEPRSVAVDPWRRLWVATDLEVGVIDPNVGWGRCLPEEDLPGAGPYRLRLEGRELVISGSGAARRLVLGGNRAAEGAFDGMGIRVNGTALGTPSEAPLGIPVGGGAVLEMEPHGSASGGAGSTARYRLNGHHWLRSLDDDGALRDLAPGRHLLEVFGFDSRLRRSRPWTVELLVSAPFYYEKWFLMGAVGALGAGILMFFMLRGRSKGTPIARVLASTAILGAISLQVAAGLWPHAKGWPFVGYSMYSQPFDPKGHVHEALLHFQDDRGRQYSRSAYSLGLAIDNPWQVLHPLINGNGPAIDRMWAIMPKLFPGKRITSFQVVSERTKLTLTGPVPVPPLVFAHFEAGDSQ